MEWYWWLLIVLVIVLLLWWLMRGRSASSGARPDSTSRGSHAGSPAGRRSAATDATAAADAADAVDAAPVSTPSTAPSSGDPWAEDGGSATAGFASVEAEAESEVASEPASEPEPGKGISRVTGPYGEGSAAPNADGSGPEGYLVKGNADSMLYHVPGSGTYERTRAEVWFRSEEDAQAAGFSPPRGNRPAD